MKKGYYYYDLVQFRVYVLMYIEGETEDKYKTSGVASINLNDKRPLNIEIDSKSYIDKISASLKSYTYFSDSSLSQYKNEIAKFLFEVVATKNK